MAHLPLLPLLSLLVHAIPSHLDLNRKPFVDEEQSIQKFFLPREYAILIPCVLLIIATTAVFSFLGLVMVQSGKKVKKA